MLEWPLDFFENDIFHIYNRGNNRQPVFFDFGHYYKFLQLMRKHVLPYADMLAWCLLPNHFHFLIHANARSIYAINEGYLERSMLSEGIKRLLSSYTKMVNHEMDFTGSRFQQNTKAKNVSSPEVYAGTAFHYIHQNPLKLGLVDKMEEWEFCSFREYIGESDFEICNRKLAVELLDLNLKNFYDESYEMVDDVRKAKIFKP